MFLRSLLPLVLLSLTSVAALAREIVVSNVAALTTLRAAPGDTVLVQGYLNPGDGGGQFLYYSRTAGGTANGGFIFDAPGSGSERFIAVDQSIADPAKFGAVTGATSAEVTAAFQAALDSGKPVINLDASKTWALNAGLKSPRTPGTHVSAVSMQIAGLITLPVSVLEPVVTFGRSDLDTSCAGRVYRLRVERSATTNATDVDGIRVINCVDGEFHLSATNCQSGIHFRGDDTTEVGPPNSAGACSRNHVWIGDILDCRTGVHLEAMGEGGYVNDNEFYGGEIQTTSSMNTADELKGLFLDFKGTTEHYINANLFLGQSIELFNAHATALKFVVYGNFTNTGGTPPVRTGDQNSFLNFRMETTSGTNTTNYRLLGGKGLSNNTFRANFMLASTNLCAGVSAGDGWRVKNAARNNFDLRHDSNMQDYWERLATVHPRQMVQTASGATAPPHGVIQNGPPVDLAFLQVAAEVTVTATEIQCDATTNFPVWVGVPIDMTLSGGTVDPDQVHDDTDRVVHIQYVLGGYGGRIFARCFESDGDITTNADDCSLPNSLGGDHFYLDSFTGQDGQGRPFVYPIAFGPNVAYVVVGLGSRSDIADEVTHIKQFEIFSKKNAGFRLLNNETVIADLSGVSRFPIFHDQEMPRSPVVPTDTNCAHGTLVRNTSESELGAGVPVFWRFDAADTVWDEVGP